MLDAEGRSLSCPNHQRSSHPCCPCTAANVFAPSIVQRPQLLDISIAFATSDIQRMEAAQCEPLLPKYISKQHKVAFNLRQTHLCTTDSTL